ncbi:putative reverse transcriptase domain-containing protein [Tanacetum coccineum]|uniref:Reverse transcriptase domain-containing protein n=1 Tax=Tanacetum coccineum TaxID=301880 RepID=A0ABQ4Y815_9ASTR
MSVVKSSLIHSSWVYGGMFPILLGSTKIVGLHYLLAKVVPVGMYRDLSPCTSGALQDPTTVTITTMTITNDEGCMEDLISLLINAWEAIRPRGIKVGWSRIVWFSHCIPRHAFHLWLVMRKSLKTQDNIRPWDVGPDVDISRLRCPLCNLHPDSHDHLFFECSFSSQVWRHVRHLADMDVVPSTAQDIVSHLLPLSNKRTAKSIIGRLVLAASAYFVWIERNNRLFKKIKRPPEEIRDLIMVTVRLKLVSLRFKSKDNNHVEDLHRFWYPYRESQVRVVLFFPSPRVFPLGFPWEGFLRRQSHLDSSPPYTWKVDVAAWKLCKSDWHVS